MTVYKNNDEKLEMIQRVPGLHSLLDASTLQLILQGVDLIVQLDEEDKICHATSGLSSAEDKLSQFLGQPISQAQFLNPSSAVTADLVDAVKGRRTFSSAAVKLFLGRSMPSVNRLSGQPIVDAEGQYQGYLMTFTDLGESGIIKAIRDELLSVSILTSEKPRALVNLDRLTQVVQEVLAYDLVMVAVRRGDNLETLSMYCDGRHLPFQSYPLANTPCAKTLKAGTYLVEDDLFQHFPGGRIEQMGMRGYAGQRIKNAEGKAIGSICVFSRHPVGSSDLLLKVLADLSFLVEPYVWNYLSARRLSEQDTVLHQAYRMAKVGAWLRYPTVTTVPELSREAREVWGLQNAVVPGLSQLISHIHPDDRDRVSYHWNHLEELGSYSLQYRITDMLGQRKWLSERGLAEYDEQGNYYRASGVVQDITSQKLAEERAQTLSHAVFESSNIVFTLDSRSCILDCNPAFETCTGYRREEVLGCSSSILNAHDLPRSLFWGVWRTLLRGHEWRGEIKNQRKNGSTYWVKTSITPVKNSDGEVISFLCVQEDITDKKNQDARLRYQAYHDSLTGLPNRISAQSSLTSRLQKGLVTSLLFIDLDGFKHVNDSMGHPVGDELLEHMAQRLHTTLQPSDLLARLGGDEFLVIVDIPEQAEELANRILEVLQYPFEIQGRSIYLGASIGIVDSPYDGDSADMLLRNVDAAMYHAKSQGKNTYSRYSKELSRNHSRRMQISACLRNALKRGELTVQFQPQQSLLDGQLVGAEALSRWCSPELGMVSPNEFIPQAEEIGLIDEIGDWVIKESLKACRKWREAGMTDATVSVNVSPRQLRNAHLLNTINRALAEYSLPSSALCVEVTETSLMENLNQAEEILKRLRSNGVKLAIDDFGVGYSSLSHLKRFPFQTLKIDRGFIGDMDRDTGDRTLVRTMIQMAHNLGLSVVAEGVETEAQYRLLCGMGCEIMQGFWVGKPLSQDDFMLLLNQRFDSELEVVHPGYSTSLL